MITTGRDCGLAEWINRCEMLVWTCHLAKDTIHKISATFFIFILIGASDVLLLRQKILDFGQQFSLDGVRDCGTTLRSDLFHDVVQLHVIQACKKEIIAEILWPRVFKGVFCEKESSYVQYK